MSGQKVYLVLENDDSTTEYVFATRELAEAFIAAEAERRRPWYEANGIQQRPRHEIEESEVLTELPTERRPT